MDGSTFYKFETKSFKVIAEALPEDAPLDDYMEPELLDEIASKLDGGGLVRFCAHVQVTHKPSGIVLGNDYLGDCIYSSLDDFRRDGLGTAKLSREMTEESGTPTCICAYFPGMIREAIQEARGNFADMKAQFQSVNLHE